MLIIRTVTPCALDRLAIGTHRYAKTRDTRSRHCLP